MFQLFVIQDRAQLTHGILTVLGLVARLGVLNQNLLLLTGIGILVLITQTHTRFYLVDVLSTGTTASECIPRDSGHIHLHLNRIVHQRSDKDRSKRGHSLALSIVGRNTHQTMHAILTLQIAVGIIAFDVDRDGLDTSLIALLQVGNRDLVVVVLGPTHIHTHQHGGPVLTLRTTGTGIDLQDTTHRIGLLTQHVAELQVLDQLQCLGVSLIQLLFGNDLLFYILIGQRQLFGCCMYLVVELDPFLQLLYLFHLGFGTLGILPKTGILRTQLLFF